jgi:16S rRNA (guanine527-N7)-methyltransferase
LPESADELPALPAEFWTIVDDGLAEVPLELPPDARAAIDAHVRLLIAWNAAINLTALRTPEQIARHHVLDSLIAVPALRELGPADKWAMIDLGSGGGLPGLPLGAVLRPRRLAVVDSIGKKARFLTVAAAAVQSATDVEIHALAERAEDLADEPEHREAWDVVLARAVGTVAECAEIGLPLARVGGRLVLWKRDAGDGALQSEIAAARRISQACGGGATRIVTLPAAGRVGLDGHCLVVIEKRRPTPDRYPRAPGERRRAPLLPTALLS